jgi:hypothetical protein
MAKFEKQLKGNYEEVVERVHDDIMNSGISMNLVDENMFNCCGTEIVVRVYDKYFARNGSRASLSVTIAGKDDDIYVSAIGAGGGKGIFFDTSFGAENDLVGIVEDSLNDMLE